jgi:pimeloyl-ACP methyl ester carboxylesterase
MKIAFEEHGTGRPFILLHAFPLNRKMWEDNIEAVISAGFRLILPDLRGFGESVNFADIHTMEDMANDVSELLENLQIEKAIFGGLSMGGYVLFNLYRVKPEIFSALVLCDTSFSADSEDKKKSRFELIDKIESAGTQALIENMLPNLISDHTKNNNPELVSKLEKMFSETDPKAAVAALRGMAARADHEDILPLIDVPTLLIFGEEDKVTNLDVADKMHESISGSRLHLIKNAGHYSNLEQPEQFNKVLFESIKKVEF